MLSPSAPPSIPDRQLLLGLMAVHLNLIDPDHLTAAFRAWPQRPDDVLRSHGRLDADQADVLERLADQLVEACGGSEPRALAAVVARSRPEELAPLLAGAGTDFPSRLTRVGVDSPTLYADVAVIGDHAAVAEVRPDGYRIRRRLARGAVGELHVAEDTALRREVALKEIRAALADDPVSRERFLLEAEITGGLEHPGIVPVHTFGVHPDGRPFYTMRLIKGETLLRAIERFHAAADRADRVARRLALRELLTRFVAVCNAVAYAHSRGVVHRDVKPGNVMLGPFGETLVVDWGLAHAAGQPFGGGTGEPPLTPSAGDLLESMLKDQVIGTPGYMSPEQAAGKSDVGPASDVYSLGVMLFVILTGRLPFTGSVPAVLAQMRTAAAPPARAVTRGVPAALSAVAGRAMAARPEDRYPSVLALAQDVTRWLADEPVSAFRDPWSTQLFRWGRRNRSLTFSALAVLVMLVVMLSVHSIAMQRQQQIAGDERHRAKVLEQLAQREQQRTQTARVAVARARIENGILRLQRGESAEAKTAFTAGRDLGRSLVAEWPDEVEPRQVLADALFHLAALAHRDRQPERAGDLLSAAVPHHLALFRLDPDAFEHRRAYRRNRILLAQVALAERDPAALAAAVADLIGESARPDGDDFVTAARFLARASTLADAVAHTDQAMAALRRAVTLGFRNTAALTTDDDLAPLRGRDDFRELVRSTPPPNE